MEQCNQSIIVFKTFYLLLNFKVLLPCNLTTNNFIRKVTSNPNWILTKRALITRDATSKVPAIESFEFVSPDLDTETLVVRQKRVKRTAQRARPQKIDSPKNPSFQPINSAKDKKTNQQGKATTAKNSVQCQESTKRM